jgi:formylglycine-generating enzyme required for sulfatase activity
MARQKQSRDGLSSSVWQRAARDADLTLELPGDVPMFFRRIPAGSFRMGSRGYFAREEPVHHVQITQDFYLGTFPVTQEQYQAVAELCSKIKGSDPSGFKGPRRPVENVNWHEASGFCHWLTEQNDLPTGFEVLLPTEAQWEYACRAGSETEYYRGDGEEALAEIGWFDENSDNETHDVDERSESHPFGLFGMHGNVWEWCRDAWDEQAYRQRPDGVCNPECAGEGANRQRVLRGGSWILTADWCRSAYRVRREAVGRFGYGGFRVCLVRSPATASGAEKE